MKTQIVPRMNYLCSNEACEAFQQGRWFGPVGHCPFCAQPVEQVAVMSKVGDRFPMFGDHGDRLHRQQEAFKAGMARQIARLHSRIYLLLVLVTVLGLAGAYIIFKMTHVLERVTAASTTPSPPSLAPDAPAPPQPVREELRPAPPPPTEEREVVEETPPPRQVQPARRPRSTGGGSKPPRHQAKPGDAIKVRN